MPVPPPASYELGVWYTCDQTLCNFSCSYCVSAEIRAAAEHRMWATDAGPARFQRIIAWLAALPWKLGVRLQTEGEAFVSKEFLAGAAWLSKQDNLAFVELVTNASFTRAQLSRFVEDAYVERLAMWATYHHGQIELDRFVDACAHAQSLGVHVVAHALLFPDTVESTRALLEACEARGLRTDVTLGLNFNDAYPGASFAPLADVDPLSIARLYRHPAAVETLQLALTRWRWNPCSAGHDYVKVLENGDVYPCGPYGLLHEGRLGSALEEGFVPALRAEPYAQCTSPVRCFCKEDYFHLKPAREALAFPRSLGYFQPRT